MPLLVKSNPQEIFRFSGTILDNKSCLKANRKLSDLLRKTEFIPHDNRSPLFKDVAES